MSTLNSQQFNQSPFGQPQEPDPPPPPADRSSGPFNGARQTYNAWAFNTVQPPFIPVSPSNTSRYVFNASPFGAAFFTGATQIPDSRFVIDGAPFNTYPFGGFISIPQGEMSIDYRSFAASWIDDRSFTLPSIGMTKVGVKIKNLVIGDDRQIKRTYSGLPLDVEIEKAWFTLKKKDKDTDAAAIIFKGITTVSAGTGQITDPDSSDGEIDLLFNLTRTETALAKPDFEYVYDIQVKTIEGGIHTLEKGTATFIRGVTAAVN